MDSFLIKTGPTLCPKCGRSNRSGQLSCGFCGHVLRKESRSALSDGVAARERSTRKVRAYSPSTAEFEFRERAPARESLLFLGIGLLLSPVFAFLPYLQFFDWFLTSLFHESGHCFFAWMMGQPAFPAISLTGHAAAMHQDQSTLLAVGVFAALAWCAWHLRDRKFLHWSFIAAAIAQPLLAFTSGKEVLFLLGGHLGELTFGTICFWRTLQGGFTQNNVERVLYAVLAWYLVGHNVALSLGLMFSEAARQEYAGNGSFGMTNDYLRLAHEVLGVSLPSVACGMLLVALIPVPLALLLWRKAAV